MLSDTPIYDQLKAEWKRHQALTDAGSTVQQAGEALNQFGQGVRAMFVSLDELQQIAPRKPLLKNRKTRR